MHSRSIANSSWARIEPLARWFADSQRSPGWLLSVILHGLILIVYALSVLDFSLRRDAMDFDVIEAPMVAQQPLRAIQPPPETQPKPKSPPRAVFGVSRTTQVATSPEDIAQKKGNTLAKEQDQKQLREDDPASIPIPVEDYLVSEMPTLLSDYRADYPAEAKKKGIQGPVVFDIVVDGQGVVRQAVLIEGPGHGLNEAALAAVKKLKFKPARVEDKTVAVKIRYAYRFVLEK